jgi:hypothetical protein
MTRVFTGSVRAGILNLPPSTHFCSLELATTWGTAISTVRAAVKRMLQYGELERVAHGLYRVAPAMASRLDKPGLDAARAAMTAALNIGAAPEDALAFAIRCYLARAYLPPIDSDNLALAIRNA